MRHLWRAGLALALLVGMAASAAAQSQATTGVIEGTVVDESGAAVPGANVTIRNTATNFERVVPTDADGRFRGLLLPLGPYRVQVSLTGFSTFVREGLQLSVGQTINLPMTLKVSNVQEEIVVSGEAPVIETTRAEGADKIDSRAVAGLPNNGRNFLDLTKLTPGVAIVQGPDGDELTINGQKGIQNNISVDGADFNNPFFGEQRGGQRPAFTFNLDAVKEVVVVAEGANAEFGRSNGGFVNVVTKSGTNDTHGTAHFFFKNDALSSAPKNVDGSKADKFDFSQQQAGFTLGGPLQKDKIFYFVALDYQNGDSTKQTEANRIDPRLVQYFAAHGAAGEDGPIDRTNDARVFLGKIDWQLNNNHLATIRYNYTWSEQKNGTFDVDSWAVSANATEKDYSHAVTGSLISTLSASTLNEFRFQWAKEFRPRPYDGPTIAGSTRPFPDTAMDFAGAYRFGEPFFIPVDYFDQRFQFNDNLSFIRGSHNIKVGAEVNRVNSNQTFRGFQNGRYIFSSVSGFLNYAQNPRYVECSNGTTSQTGSCGGADIVGPLLLFLQQTGVGGLSAEEAGTQDIPQLEVAAFVQDKWQPSRTLTVQFGLRWEMQDQADMITPPSQVFYSNFIGRTVSNSFGSHTFPSNGEIPSDRKMFQPRLGISWDPKGDGKTVVRLAGGLFYGRIPGLSLASSRSTNGSRAQNYFRASFFNGFGVTPPAYPNLLPAPAASEVPDHPSVFVFDEDFRNPRTWSGSIGIERELAPNFSGLIQYNYSKGQNITRFVEGNDTAFGCPWGTGLGANGQNGIACGSSGGGGLTVVESTGKSLYHGLTLGLTRRWANNVQGQVNYTMSWDKSDDDNERDPFTYRYIDINNLAAEYGYSDRDQRHRLNAFLLWKTPGEVNVNFRYSYRSAQPLSLSAAGTPSQAVFGPQSDRIRPDGSIVERNTGRKENEFSSLDVRLSREFKVSDRLTLEPIAEAFNVLGSKNFRQPSYGNLLFNFDGTIASGLGDPRQAQLGLRAIW